MSFLLNAGREAAEEPVTMQIKLSLRTRGNFSMVLPVRFCGGVKLRARYQWRPQTSLFAAFGVYRLCLASISLNDQGTFYLTIHVEHEILFSVDCAIL